MLQRIQLYWRTIGYLRFEQVFYLVWRRLLKLPRKANSPPDISPKLAAAARCLVPLSSECWLGTKRFRFLNHERDFGDVIDWQVRGESRLWQYNLHYFDWLRQRNCDSRIALGHIEEWILGNPPFSGAGWEPYPSSLRLVNWLGALADLPAAAISGAVIDSIALQTSWLEKNIEYQLGANHLFVNLKALLFAAAFLGGEYGRGLARRIAKRFKRELAEQFLSDGGHYERSPMYHNLLTMDLLELTALLNRNPSVLSLDVAQSIRETSVRALNFAEALRAPDDGVFLFNDSVPGIGPVCGELVDFATQRCGIDAPIRTLEFGLKALSATGYYVVKGDGDMIVFDCGEIGPDYQPGHAHCDTLSFELYLDGQRILTNAGNHDYGVGATRAYARSTRAHNTVVVDDSEQSEVWGAFRVGRRARPLGATLERQGASVLFRGGHDGYRRLAGEVTHTRSALVSKRFVIELRDDLMGAECHRVSSWLHAAVGLNIIEAEYGFEILDEFGRRLVRLEPASGCRASVEHSARYPQFGIVSAGMSLCLSAEGALPIALACRIIPLRGGQ